MFFRRRSSPLDEARHKLSDVSHTISDVGHNLSERVQDTLRHAPERLGELRETVGEAVSHVGEAVSHVREAMEPKAEAAKAKADAVRSKAETVKSALFKSQKQVQEEAKVQKRRFLPRFRSAASEYSEARADASRQAEASAAIASERAEVATGESGYSKWLWLGFGVLLGIFIGLLMAPTSGRRSRALIKDKLNKGRHAAADAGAATVGKVADVGHKAQGLVHRVEDKVRGGADDADDNTIADRVRTALGQHETTRHIERLNIDVVDGAVTVRGPLVETAQREAIETVVRGVKGVREVQSQLLEDSDDDATFVG